MKDLQTRQPGKWAGIWLALSLLASCAGYQPAKKWAPEALQKDLDVAWNTYCVVHPSYDWYTPADSVNAAFARVRASLTDSLSEPEFRLRLSYAVVAIRCGHTSVRASKAYTKYAANRKEPGLPFDVQVLAGDSMVVRATRAGAAALKRGDVVQAIDGVAASVLVKQMRQYITSDGYNTTFKDAAISYGFPARFRQLYGLREHYTIDYLDSLGVPRQTKVSLFRPKTDSGRAKPTQSGLSKAKAANPPKVSVPYKRLYLDSTETIGTMQVERFSGKKAKKFYRKSFRLLAEKNVSQLILDVSENTGGQINQYVQLTRYLTNKSFRIADSVSAVGFKFPYPGRVQANWYYRTLNWLMVHRDDDQRWHMGANERPTYKPRKKYQYSGKVYALTGGFSFSATSLLLHSLKDQPNVVRIGVETGGGARGNSAVNTPNITLPNSKIRMRLPLFRLVTDHQLPHTGRGIMPHIPAPPTSYTVRKGIRPELEAALQLIRADATQKTNRP